MSILRSHLKTMVAQYAALGGGRAKVKRYSYLLKAGVEPYEQSLDGTELTYIMSLKNEAETFHARKIEQWNKGAFTNCAIMALTDERVKLRGFENGCEVPSTDVKIKLWEGFALTPPVKFPTSHQWLTINGKLCDLTWCSFPAEVVQNDWKAVGKEYLGVWLTCDELRVSMAGQNGYYSILEWWDRQGMFP